MDFTLPSFCTLPDSLRSSELLEMDRATATATYRVEDFEGLTPREQLFKKLEIMAMRGECLNE